MPTIVSHAVVAVALIPAFPGRFLPRKWMLLGAAYAILPDLDVVGFHFGIQYADILGHRGLTHSLVFAVVVAFLGQFAVRPFKVDAHFGLLWLYLFLATASHGVLDAFTNGGLGVAFFSPIDITRYFFPFHPIAVSPIGTRFFSGRALPVLLSELQWVWLPSIAFGLIAVIGRQSLLRTDKIKF